MTIWIAALLLSVAAGWFLVRALTAGAWAGPRWATLAVEVSLGALFGPGLVSILFFALTAIGAGSRGSAVAVVGFLLAVCAGVWWKFTPLVTAERIAPKTFPWTWVLWICAAAGLVFLILDFQTASSGNPNGDWDAMSTWNLRARYFASSGDLWHRAVSGQVGGNMIGAQHPGYPLFLSGFIGLAWSAAGLFDQAVPVAVSLMFAFGTLVLLGASVACRKSTALGLLAWCVLLASEVFASQAAVQYSDLLEGFAFLAAIVLLDAAAGREEISPRVLIAAGLAAGLACWTKNEGIPFAIAALAAGAWRFRKRGWGWLAVGAAPGVLALAALKLMAQGREGILPQTVGEAVEKIAGAGRWWQAALGFGKAIYDAGNPWTHPVVLVAVLALALGFASAAERRARWWLWIPVAVTAAAEYGLYLVTTADLDWHISTSVSRLVAQLWPSLIWLVLVMLRSPEEFFEAPVVVAESKPATRKSGRRVH
jgi:hypothetical protein